LHVALSVAELAPVLQVLVKFSSSRHQLIDIKANSGITTIGCADGDFATSFQTDKSFIRNEGQAAVSFDSFYKIIGSLPRGGVVDLHTFADVMEVRSNGVVFTLLKDDCPGSFPPETGTHPSLRIQGAVLRHMVQQVIYAAGSVCYQGHPLWGILWQQESEQLQLVATDTKRIALASGTPVEGKKLSAIVPKRILEVFSDIEGDEIADVFFYKAGVSIRVGPYEFSSRLLLGDFPDWQSKIPVGKAKTYATFDRLPLLESLVSFKAVGVDNGVFDFRENGTTIAGVLISGPVSDFCPVSTETPVHLAGDAVEILLNVKYLREFVQALDAPKVVIGLSGPNKPITVGSNLIDIMGVIASCNAGEDE